LPVLRRTTPFVLNSIQPGRLTVADRQDGAHRPGLQQLARSGAVPSRPVPELGRSRAGLLRRVTGIERKLELIEPTLAPPTSDKPSLAVLPFENLSGDPEQEYFVDGMVEEITTAISRLPWLVVIARNSSFTYRGKGSRREADGAGAWRALRARRLGQEDRQPGAHRQPADRPSDRSRLPTSLPKLTNPISIS